MSSVQDPRPDGGRPRQVRLYDINVKDIRHSLPSVGVPMLILGLVMVAWKGTVLGFVPAAWFLIVVVLGWLSDQREVKFKIEISTDRLRVLDAGRTSYGRPRWVEFHRGEVGSVTVRDGWLSVSDQSGQSLIHHRTGGRTRTRTLRRALERHYWC